MSCPCPTSPCPCDPPVFTEDGGMEVRHGIAWPIERKRAPMPSTDTAEARWSSYIAWALTVAFVLGCAVAAIRGA
jgi:hypothetical protein